MKRSRFLFLFYLTDLLCCPEIGWGLGLTREHRRGSWGIERFFDHCAGSLVESFSLVRLNYLKSSVTIRRAPNSPGEMSASGSSRHSNRESEETS